MQTYRDEIAPGMGFPLTARPSLMMNHIDGPLLTFRDGQMHWLTWRERISVWLGRDDAESLERKHRPKLVAAVTGQGGGRLVDEIEMELAAVLREERMRQYRDQDRAKWPGGIADYEANQGPWLEARAALAFLRARNMIND